MRKADGKLVYAEFIHSGSSPSVEMNQGSPTPIGQYLDITPGNPAIPCAQCLHHRLLARKAGRQLRQPPATVFDLPLGVNTIEETITPRIYRCSDAGYLNYIYSVCMHTLTPGYIYSSP